MKHYNAARNQTSPTLCLSKSSPSQPKACYTLTQGVSLQGNSTRTHVNKLTLLIVPASDKLNRQRAQDDLHRKSMGKPLTANGQFYSISPGLRNVRQKSLCASCRGYEQKLNLFLVSFSKSYQVVILNPATMLKRSTTSFVATRFCTRYSARRFNTCFPQMKTF